MMLRVPILIGVALTNLACARGPDAESRIKDVLTSQAEAWNRGDISSFVGSYAEDCVFVGKQVLQGRAKLLARYRKTYPSAESMGRLTFENLTVHQLNGQIATAVGEWHIDRPSASGGPVGGVFSLVLQLRKGAWLIVLDHTT